MDPDSALVRIRELKMEPFKAVDAHNRGEEANNEAAEGLSTSGLKFAYSHHFDEEQDPYSGSALK
jgi:hypothetical protein